MTQSNRILLFLVVVALLLVSFVFFSFSALAVTTQGVFSDFHVVITGTAQSVKVTLPASGSGLCDDSGASDFIDSFYIPSFDATYTGDTFFTTINTDYPAQFLEADLPQFTDLCVWWFTGSWNTDTSTPFQYQPATPEPTAPASSSEATLVTATSMFASSFLFMVSFLGIISYFTWRSRSSL